MHILWYVAHPIEGIVSDISIRNKNVYKRVTCYSSNLNLNIFAQEKCVWQREKKRSGSLFAKNIACALSLWLRYLYVKNEDNRVVIQHPVFNVFCFLSAKRPLPGKTRKHNADEIAYSERAEWTMKNTERMK